MRSDPSPVIAAVKRLVDGIWQSDLRVMASDTEGARPNQQPRHYFETEIHLLGGR
jgi:hypothetical protein